MIPHTPWAHVPTHLTSRLEIVIRFCETDLMGIVHHANYLTYFEAGRVEWLRRRGVTYAEWAAKGVHLPVVEAMVRYRLPARFDEELELETSLTQRRAVSLRFEYRLRRDATLLAEGFTRLACLDGKHALQRIPEDMYAVLEGPEI